MHCAVRPGQLEILQRQSVRGGDNSVEFLRRGVLQLSERRANRTAIHLWLFIG